MIVEVQQKVTRKKQAFFKTSYILQKTLIFRISHQTGCLFFAK